MHSTILGFNNPWIQRSLDSTFLTKNDTLFKKKTILLLPLASRFLLRELTEEQLSGEAVHNTARIIQCSTMYTTANCKLNNTAHCTPLYTIQDYTLFNSSAYCE